MKPSYVGLLLAAANLGAWVMFLALRPPLDSAYVAEIDQQRAAARAEGGIAIHGNSAITVIGCRPIVKQAHGDELLTVRVLQLVNMPAMVPAILGMTVVHVLMGQPAYCTESWIFAALFLSFSSAQWLVLGALMARLVNRLRGLAESPPIV